MATELQTAPYAPPANVIDVLHHARKRGLPEIITPRVLASVGVPEGNASRTLATLRFLGLTEEDGHKTGRFESLARVTDEEYPEQLAQVIREAYATVFTYVDPAEDGALVKLNNVFRQHYNPQAQRTRMVTLFLALCREAGIIESATLEPRPRARRVTVSKDQGAKSTRASRTQQTPEIQQAPLLSMPSVSSASTKVEVQPQAPDIDSYYSLCLETLKRLPPDHRWTAKQRDKWLAAIRANVELLVDVVDEDESASRALTIFEAEGRAQ